MAADTRDQTVVVHVTQGEILDQRWLVEHRIGQGAMGSVFRGRDLQTNKVVAIKILAPQHCRKPKVVARFEREAEKMTGLRHPNIVAFHGHGRRGVLPFIVMEFLEGLSLAEVLEKHHGKLGLSETVTIVKQIASGLSFLHHNGLVHRDIKPQNVFLGVEGRVTILDLGVVRDQHNPGFTRPGAMVGTPYYMSPEQILGAEDIDKRTDVYALAAMTFEFLTGRPPYLGKTNFEVLYGHKNTAPPDAASLVKSVPKSVSKVLMRGLSKRREARPDTAIEFATDLQAASATKQVDLAKAFNLTPAHISSGSDPNKTRVVRRHPKVLKPQPPPPSDSQVPEAEDSDVVSVPETSDQSDTPEPTQIVRVISDDTQEQVHLGSVRGTEVAPAHGQLRVAVTARGQLAAEAEIFVDERNKGSTRRVFALPAGRHRIRVELEDYRTVELWAEVDSGTWTELRVDLELA